MELALLATAFGELYKLIVCKLGSEKAQKLTYVAVFIACVLFVLAKDKGVITQEMIAYTISSYFAAVGLYNVVIKKLVYPTITRLKK